METLFIIKDIGSRHDLVHFVIVNEFFYFRKDFRAIPNKCTGSHTLHSLLYRGNAFVDNFLSRF